MTASFRKIDYSLRPAKHAERKMLSEIFGRMRVFEPLSSYQYIGFGSLWFSDFYLFHKLHGVSELISIEKTMDKKVKSRFKDNVPYKNINLRFGHASDELPRLNWGKRAFVWLDYDGTFNGEIVQDLRAVLMRVRSGSLVTISYNTESAEEVDAENGGASPLNAFYTKYSKWGLSNGSFTEVDLRSWRFSELSRGLLLNAAEDALATRNARDRGTGPLQRM